MLRRWICFDASSGCLKLGNPYLDLQLRSCALMMRKAGKNLDQEVLPRRKWSHTMFPLNSIIKNAFDKFDQDFQTANLPEGKYIQRPSTVKWYQLGQSCYEDKIQELNTDFAKICISPKSSGLLWSRFLFQFLKNWNIRQDRNFPLAISLLPLPRLPLSVTLEKCQYSLKHFQTGQVSDQERCRP